MSIDRVRKNFEVISPTELIPLSNALIQVELAIKKMAIGLRTGGKKSI